MAVVPHDATVGVFAVVVVQRSVLLLRSAKEPHLWTLPGGTPRGGEDTLDVLRRELREETGCELVPGEARIVRSESVADGGAREVAYYPLEAAVVFEPVLSPEHEEYRWTEIDSVGTLAVDSHLDGKKLAVLIAAASTMITASLGGQVLCPS